MESTFGMEQRSDFFFCFLEAATFLTKSTPLKGDDEFFMRLTSPLRSMIAFASELETKLFLQAYHHHLSILSGGYGGDERAMPRDKKKCLLASPIIFIFFFLFPSFFRVVCTTIRISFRKLEENKRDFECIIFFLEKKAINSDYLRCSRLWWYLNIEKDWRNKFEKIVSEKDNPIFGVVDTCENPGWRENKDMIFFSTIITIRLVFSGALSRRAQDGWHGASLWNEWHAGTLGNCFSQRFLQEWEMRKVAKRNDHMIPPLRSTRWQVREKKSLRKKRQRRVWYNFFFSDGGASTNEFLRAFHCATTDRAVTTAPPPAKPHLTQTIFFACVSLFLSRLFVKFTRIFFAFWLTLNIFFPSPSYGLRVCVKKILFELREKCVAQAKKPI